MKYERHVAEAILEPNNVDIQGDGVLGQINEEHSRYGGGTAVLNDGGIWPNRYVTEPCLEWKPVFELRGQPESHIDCEKSPGLPFPFTANELAAWMLDGIGALVVEGYGGWENGPELSPLENPRHNLAKEAIQAAFDSYRTATAVVGHCPIHLFDEAQKLAERFEIAWSSARRKHGLVTDKGAINNELGDEIYSQRFELAKADVATLKAELGAAQERRDAAWFTWRKAMVQQLLTLQPSQSVCSTQSQEAAPVEVVETAAQRRHRYLDLVEAEGKRSGDHGALQRVADSLGVDRANMGRVVRKAREEREDTRRAGKSWGLSQLVQAGKRKT